MITLPLDAKDHDVLRLVRSWVELLAQDRYDEAFAMLRYPLGEGCTPEVLRALISNYGSLEPLSDGRTMRVSSLNSNAVHPDGRSKPYQDVEWWEQRQGCVGWVHFDLPLNGEFSDLTAIFNIMKEGDSLALELQTVHVL